MNPEPVDCKPSKPMPFRKDGALAGFKSRVQDGLKKRSSVGCRLQPIRAQQKDMPGESRRRDQEDYTATYCYQTEAGIGQGGSDFQHPGAQHSDSSLDYPSACRV